jgi:hypothetical protein
MAARSTTDYAALLKRIYSPKQVQYMAFQNRPFLGMVPKNTSNFGGSAYGLPVEYGRNPGRSATFSNAQTNQGGTSSKQFLITRFKDYGIARVETELEMASKGNASAFMEAMKNHMERTIDGVGFSLAHALWSNGGGAIGKVSAVSTDTVTLTTLEDSINFYPGQVLQADTTDGTSGTVHTGTVTVKSVDHDAGKVVATANWATGISAIAANDYLFQQGDFGAKLKGIPGWIPTTAPTSGDSFFGVDRSVSPNDLAGLRPVVTGASTIHEKIIKACGKASRMGAMVDKIFMNPEDMSSLCMEIEGKTVYHKITSPKSKELAQVSYDALKFMTPMGAIDVVADMHCPKGYVYGLRMDTWQLGSLGGAPIVLAEGKDIFVYNEDAKEIRVGYYASLYCNAPHQNFVFAL